MLENKIASEVTSSSEKTFPSRSKVTESEGLSQSNIVEREESSTSNSLSEDEDPGVKSRSMLKQKTHAENLYKIGRSNSGLSAEIVQSNRDKKTNSGNLSREKHQQEESWTRPLEREESPRIAGGKSDMRANFIDAKNRVPYENWNMENFDNSEKESLARETMSSQSASKPSKKNGRDEQDCNCEQSSWPVCSSAGRTHINRCMMLCLNETLAHNGPCQKGKIENKKSSKRKREIDSYKDKYEIKGQARNTQIEEFSPFTQETDNKEFQGPSSNEKPSIIELSQENFEYCGCSDDSSPVCGSDRLSYKNECTARCMGVNIASNGVCNEENICDEIEKKPENQHFRKNSKNIKHRPSKVVKSKSGMNSENFKAFNEFSKKDQGKSFQTNSSNFNLNSKVLNENRLPGRYQAFPTTERSKDHEDSSLDLKASVSSKRTIDHVFPTAPSLDCSPLVQPVCGENRKSYENDCLAAKSNIPVIYSGVCINIDCLCFGKNNPVCGSNDKTYPDECTAACFGITKFAKVSCR